MTTKRLSRTIAFFALTLLNVSAFGGPGSGYNKGVKPVITSASTVNSGHGLLIRGDHFGKDQPTVVLGSGPVMVSRHSETEIVVDAPNTEAATTYSLTVTRGTDGAATSKEFYVTVLPATSRI